MSARRLESLGRRRCWVPTIKAEEIEEKVWFEIVHFLTYGYGGFEYLDVYQPTRLEVLIGDTKYDERIAQLETIMKRQEGELTNKGRAKSRIMGLLEIKDDFNQAEFLQKLTLVKSEILTLRNAIQETKKKIQTLQEARANNEKFLEFARNNQKWLAGIWKDLYNLSPGDKKLFVESTVPDKIRVRYAPNVEEWESGPEWSIDGFPFSFNMTIFERLISEGKIRGLTLNDRDHRFVQVL